MYSRHNWSGGTIYLGDGRSGGTTNEGDRQKHDRPSETQNKKLLMHSAIGLQRSYDVS